METRNVKISLELAKDWYNSQDATLKELALSAFSEDELSKVTLDEIKSKVVCLELYNFLCPIEDVDKYRALVQLSTIAKYFNRDWKKTSTNTGYFIASVMHNLPFQVIRQGEIKNHTQEVYPGVIYFKNYDDAYKAMNMINFDKLIDQDLF